MPANGRWDLIRCLKVNDLQNLKTYRKVLEIKHTVPFFFTGFAQNTFLW